MDIQIQRFDAIPAGQRQDIAETVAEYSRQLADQGLVVGVTSKQVLERLGVVALDNETLAGYVGAKSPVWYDDRQEYFMQVGTLIVAESYQRKGIGQLLVPQITKIVLREKYAIPFAFCGENSRTAFAAANYEEATHHELPADVSSAFGNRPMLFRGDM